MRDTFAPLRLKFDTDGFVLDARLLFAFDPRIPVEKREGLAREAEYGIRKIWSFALALDDEIEQNIREYLKAREPESLPTFERYLKRERERVEKEAIQKAVTLLKRNLLSLQARDKAPPLPPFPQSDGMLIRFRTVCGYESARFPRLRYLKSFFQGTRRPLLIHFKPYRVMPAHVNSGIMRRFWGVFRNRTVISLGFNWAPKFPGRIFLPTRYNKALLQRVAAHEFGHCMGLGDAYAAWYRCYDEAPGSGSYLMNSNGNVSAEEFRMVLTARVREKMINFPFRCSWQRFWQGFKEEVARLSRNLNRSDKTKR